MLSQLGFNDLQAGIPSNFNWEATTGQYPIRVRVRVRDRVGVRVRVRVGKAEPGIS